MNGSKFTVTRDIAQQPTQKTYVRYDAKPETRLQQQIPLHPRQRLQPDRIVLQYIHTSRASTIFSTHPSTSSLISLDGLLDMMTSNGRKKVAEN